MLKIAIVSDVVYPYSKGGGEKRIYEISKRLAERGHEVTIYCMKWWKGDKHYNRRKYTDKGNKSLFPILFR